MYGERVSGLQNRPGTRDTRVSSSVPFVIGVIVFDDLVKMTGGRGNYQWNFIPIPDDRGIYKLWRRAFLGVKSENSIDTVYCNSTRTREHNPLLRHPEYPRWFAVEKHNSFKISSQELLCELYFCAFITPNEVPGRYKTSSRWGWHSIKRYFPGMSINIRYILHTTITSYRPLTPALSACKPRCLYTRII